MFRVVYAIFVAATLLNFFVFVAIAGYIGGDAVNGKTENGHYYVFGTATRGGQKVYTEVSEALYNYSRWHVYSLFVTWPLMMAGAFVVRRKGDAPSCARWRRVLRGTRRRLGQR